MDLRRHTSRTLPLLTALVSLLAAPAVANAGLTAFTVTNSVTPDVVRFDVTTPGTVQTVPVSGLTASEQIIGMDVRPATGEFYVLTRHTASGLGRLRTINPFTGVLGAAITLSPEGGDDSPYVTITFASQYDVDFNPVSDSLRIVSGGDINWQINPTTGVVRTDTNLAYGLGDPNAGNDPGVRGLAYTNAFFGAGTTTLYDYDYDADRLTFQSSVAGTLGTIGISGVTAQGLVGLDASAVDNALFASFETAGVQRLFTLNAGTGAASVVGAIGAGATTVHSLTTRANIVSIDSTAPITKVEGLDATLSIPITRTGPLDSTDVTWRVTPTSATATAADTGSATGTVTFAPGETAKVVSIPLTDDSLDEPLESFSVTLEQGAPAKGRAYMTPGAVPVTLADNDVAPAPTTTPPTTTPPTPDTTKPVALVLPVANLAIGKFTKRGVAIKLLASEAGTVKGTLKLGKVTVATASVTTSTPKISSLTFKPTKAGTKAIAAAKGKRVKLALTLVITDAAGNATTVKLPVTLTR